MFELGRRKQLFRGCPLLRRVDVLVVVLQVVQFLLELVVENLFLPLNFLPRVQSTPVPLQLNCGVLINVGFWLLLFEQDLVGELSELRKTLLHVDVVHCI